MGVDVQDRLTHNVKVADKGQFCEYCWNFELREMVGLSPTNGIRMLCGYCGLALTQFPYQAKSDTQNQR